MKSKEEKEYYTFLEKIIREQKAHSPFFRRGSESYEMDVLMLMNHIAKKNPRLAEKIIDNFVDTTGMEHVSKQDILAFMGKTEKGTIARWKSESGEEVFLINNGDNLFRKSKRVIVLGSHLDKNDMNLVRKSIYGNVLKKDIQHIYEKIAQDNLRKRQKGKIVSAFDYITSQTVEKNEHTASLFEKNFKELVKSQGSTCVPFATASTMISFMDNHEKQKLSESLATRGVKDTYDLERLLSRWKHEALNPEYTIQRTRRKKKEIAVRER